MYLGAHVSTSGGVFNAPKNGADLGIDTIAVFVKNQRQWKAKPFTDEDLSRWREAVSDFGIARAVSHVSYLINPCAPDPEKRRKSIDALVDEVERAEALGLTNVVIHPGSHLKMGEEWGVGVIADSLDEVHLRTAGASAKITLEITAGQGTNLGYRFEQIASIIEQTGENERLAVCFDTCHAFAAGYSLQTEEEYEAVWEEFDRVIGLGRLEVFHLNDSKTPFGGRVDRHEKIGKGLMGLEPFRFLVNDERFTHIPGILETPEADGGYAADLLTLQNLLDTER